MRTLSGALGVMARPNTGFISSKEADDPLGTRVHFPPPPVFADAFAFADGTPNPLWKVRLIGVLFWRGANGLLLFGGDRVFSGRLRAGKLSRSTAGDIDRCSNRDRVLWLKLAKKLAIISASETSSNCRTAAFRPTICDSKSRSFI